jgi:hypothetical protein
MTPKKFAMIIEEIVKEGKGGVNYMEAILEYCENVRWSLILLLHLSQNPSKKRLKQMQES